MSERQAKRRRQVNRERVQQLPRFISPEDLSGLRDILVRANQAHAIRVRELGVRYHFTDGDQFNNDTGEIFRKPVT